VFHLREAKVGFAGCTIWFEVEFHMPPAFEKERNAVSYKRRRANSPPVERTGLSYGALHAHCPGRSKRQFFVGRDFLTKRDLPAIAPSPVSNSPTVPGSGTGVGAARTRVNLLTPSEVATLKGVEAPGSFGSITSTTYPAGFSGVIPV
jgi:hypothetical protein